jgi:cytochrome c556
MLKKLLLGTSCAALSLGLFLPCQAAAPVKLSQVAPVTDLVPEAEAKIKIIEEELATEEAYNEAKAPPSRLLGTNASTLSVLAQAIAEHEDDSAWKKSAPDIRDAAKAIGSAKTYDDAKKGLEDLKAAVAGKGKGAKAVAEWHKLGRMGRMMAEATKRQNKIRRGMKKLPEGADELAREASVMAVLGLAMHEDTHEVKNPAEKPEWYKFATDFHTSATELSKALKAKDTAASKAAFAKNGKSCSECHDKFRKHE